MYMHVDEAHRGTHDQLSRAISVQVGHAHRCVDVRAQLRQLRRQVELHRPLDATAQGVKHHDAARHVLLLVDDDPHTDETRHRVILQKVGESHDQVERPISVNVGEGRS